MWVVGAAVEEEATILHWDGEEWTRHASGFDDDLWWVHIVDEGNILFGGARGALLHHDGESFRRLDTPALARQTIYGVWADRMDAIWAVGGTGARSGFLWHYDGSDWSSLRLPADLPLRAGGATGALFKVAAAPEGELLVVGGEGALSMAPSEALTTLHLLEGEVLFTVAVGPGGEALAVGGGSEGVILDVRDGSVHRTPSIPLLQGIAFGPDGDAWASGAFGSVLRQIEGEWEEVPHMLATQSESLHAIWVSPSGAVWAVGGTVLSSELDAGVLVHGAPRGVVAPTELEPPAIQGPPTGCPVEARQVDDAFSAARLWNETMLDAIRRSLPEPTVHARNLYHLSLLLHDVWTHMNPNRSALVYGEEVALQSADYLEAASHAAYRLLEHRYAARTGGETTLACLRAQMEALGLDPDFRDAAGEGPAALGFRIGEAIVDHFREDGALEHLDYDDPRYAPPNPPLRVDEPGVQVDDASSWQELIIARAMTQNGIPEPGGPIRYIGPHWGGVTPFAIRRPDVGVPYFPLGERPELYMETIVEEVVDVIRKTAQLDPESGQVIDISPGRYGNNPVGEDGGEGHASNPATGEPYAPQPVAQGDFARVLAEYWADGPDSETPPGHWNVIAHRAFDHEAFVPRFYGEGPVVDRLTWDVQAYLILNGALHDAAIVAWEAKRAYETARPITLIRWMALQGQRSDPTLPSYDPDGLPLIEDLIEVITEESSAPGERHEALYRHVGEIAIWTWPGEPGQHERERSAMRWVRGVEWMPYQPRTFVTPAFPGYVSGHSTFSHAAARVLERLTATRFFPGGMAEFVAEENGYLEFEAGPSTDVRLQWATWQDAADQAGQSRIWGGIHIAADDFKGRSLGWETGNEAANWGARHIAGFLPLPTVGDPANPLHNGNPLEDLVEEPGAPPTGDSAITVGTGRTAWESLTQGMALRWEAGPQGGYHVWATLRMDADLAATLDGAARSELRVRFRVRSADGTVLAEALRIGGWRDGPEDSLELLGTFVPLGGTIDPTSLSGRLLELSAELSVEGDDDRRSQVSFLSACCD